MQSTAILGLSLFSMRRRGSTSGNDLDIALAGAQAGLEKKRQRWLLFLIEKEEQCKSQIAQTADLDRHAEPSGDDARSTLAEAHNSYGS